MSFRGNRAFDRCDVKVVEFKDFVHAREPQGDETWGDIPSVLSDSPSEDTRIFSGNGAVLHCPMTEDERVKVESQFTDHPSRSAALKSLRKNAGELLCRNCRYSNMSAIEASQERAALARAEVEQLEGIKARRQAVAELQEADPDFKLYE